MNMRLEVNGYPLCVVDPLATATLDVMSLCPSQARELHLAITLQVAVGLVGLTEKYQVSGYNVIVSKLPG